MTLTTFRSGFMAAQNAALCICRKWWRPLTCMAIAGGAIVNLVLIPLVNWQVPNMLEASAYVTAATAAFAVREWGKHKGTVE